MNVEKLFNLRVNAVIIRKKNEEKKDGLRILLCFCLFKYLVAANCLFFSFKENKYLHLL